MEAQTLCALMLKAKKVFAREQTFLSFPISPLPYTPRQLDFFDESSAAALLESIHHRQEFSTVVDLIPPGEAWQPAGDGRLSQAYESVLASAELAVSSRTADEESRYAAARDELRNGDQDSDKLVAYRKCRDAYLLAEQRYTAARLTAASATAQEQRQWEETTSPALRRELAELMEAWMFEGFKEDIENAQAQVATLGARSPAMTWSDWRAHFNPDVDSLTDAMDGTSVMPAGFSPGNAVAEGAWRSFTLSPAEVSALLHEAPPAWLAATLGAAPAEATQSISFEFSSAAIVRPWFDPALFKARFWRFGPGDRMLSDGKSPPTGECPAYVAAVVFARRISVTGAASSAPAPARFEGFRFLHTEALEHASIIERVSTPPPAPAPPHHQISPHLMMRREALTTPSAFTAAAPPTSAGLARRRIAADEAITGRGLLAAIEVQPPPARAVSPVTANARALNQFARLKVDRAVQEENAPAPEHVADPDTIYVLAFICKPLPQCPDPDPALQW